MKFQLQIHFAREAGDRIMREEKKRKRLDHPTKDTHIGRENQLILRKIRTDLVSSD